MARILRTLLTDEVLDRVHERAPVHDRENTFPHDDLADLVGVGYLTAFVPERLGGAGLTLEEVAREQVRLAAAAPATALAVNMHLVVTGLAALLVGRGDDSVEFVLRDAARRGGVRVRQLRARQRPRDVRVAHPGAAPAGRLVPVHRHEDLHVAVARVDTAGHVRARRRRPGRPATGARGGVARGRRRRDARRLGHARDARHAVGHHGARRRPRPGRPGVPLAPAGSQRRPVRVRALRGLRDPARGRVHGHRATGDRARRSRLPGAGRR